VACSPRLPIWLPMRGCRVSPSLRRDSSLWPCSSRRRAGITCIPICESRTFLHVDYERRGGCPATPLQFYPPSGPIRQSGGGHEARLYFLLPSREREAHRERSLLARRGRHMHFLGSGTDLASCTRRATHQDRFHARPLGLFWRWRVCSPVSSSTIRRGRIRRRHPWRCDLVTAIGSGSEHGGTARELRLSRSTMR